MRTFENLMEELCQNRSLDSIPNVNGIYKVYLPNDFEVEIRAETDAIDTYHGRPLRYSVEELQNKYIKISAIENNDKYLLYIGKANQSNRRGLQKRITEFTKYGYGDCNNHRGGRAIWQLANNKKLFIDYFECEDPKKREKEELSEYRNKYGTYPFANWRL